MIKKLLKSNALTQWLYLKIKATRKFFAGIKPSDLFQLKKIILILKVKPYTLLSYRRLSNLYEQALNLEKNGIEGSFVECGVWNGGSAGIIARVARNRDIWLFDSWEGMPEPKDVDVKFKGVKGKKGGRVSKIQMPVCGSLFNIHFYQIDTISTFPDFPFGASLASYTISGVPCDLTSFVTVLDITTAPLVLAANVPYAMVIESDNTLIRAWDPPDFIDIYPNGHLMYFKQGQWQFIGALNDLAFRFLGDPLIKQINIDIKPGSDPNAINSKSHGMIPIALLSDGNFDAPRVVDTISLTFGKTGEEKSLVFCNKNGEDINNDGFLDLICHFDTRRTNLRPGDTEGIVKGKTLNNLSFEGKDSVKIVK